MKSRHYHNKNFYGERLELRSCQVSTYVAPDTMTHPGDTSILGVPGRGILRADAGERRELADLLGIVARGALGEGALRVDNLGELPAMAGMLQDPACSSSPRRRQDAGLKAPLALTRIKRAMARSGASAFRSLWMICFRAALIGDLRHRVVAIEDQLRKLIMPVDPLVVQPLSRFREFCKATRTSTDGTRNRAGTSI